ncbi:MAG TPA: GAF domain-containing protein, partial [Coleofasciculaceae cyanobacterium]
TGGNPFFVKEFLKTLYAENLITFNNYTPSEFNSTPIQSTHTLERGVIQNPTWNWDISQIHMRGITANVVELMIRQLKKLPKPTQYILRLAACIGSNFNLKMLCLISDKTTEEIFINLREAIQQGLIIPTSELDEKLLIHDYKFRHDRIQQAAYRLIKDYDKKTLHLQIGRLLLHNTLPNQLSDKIFEIVDHFNFALSSILSPNERNEIAHLNLMAGKKAKTATAYDSAVQYLTIGRQLLGDNSWETEYDLTLDFYIESVEVEYLNANYQQAETLANVVLERAKTILEKIKVYKTKILIYSTLNQMQAAIDKGLEVLALLGVSLSEARPQNLNVEELDNLPTMTDPYKEAALRVLIILFAPIYITNPARLPCLAFTLVQLCINYGNSPLAAYAYGLYGLILCSVLNDIESGYRFGKLALRILDKFDAKEIQCRVYNNFYSFISHWKEATRLSLDPLRNTIQMGLETGEVEFTCYASTNYCQNLILLGEPLQYVASEIQNYIVLIRSLKQEYQVNYPLLWQQFVAVLIRNPEGQSNQLFNLEESGVSPDLIQNQDLSLLYHFYLIKIILNYLFKNYAQAVDDAQALEKCESGIIGLFPSTQTPFYCSLALLAQYPCVSASEQIHYLEKIAANQQRLQAWADHAPMNYLHKYQLVEAEKARVLQKNWEASELYEQAIQGANQNQYLHEEALAYELAAEFYLACGRTKIAQTYMNEAHYCYCRWQATSKVRDLEERYPQFFSQKLLSLPKTTTSLKTRTELSSTLDLTSVLKASQALSGELALEPLLTKMMRIVIENAAAQTGYLILNKEEQWVIEASGTIASDDVQILQSIPIEQVSGSSDTPMLSNAIANYVIRTQQSLVLHDAAHAGEFTRDPYILKQQPKSLLCTPLIHQGKLVGILYLENNLITG